MQQPDSDSPYGPATDFVAPDAFEAFVESRRLAQNGLLWQIPGLSLTAQSFLIGSAVVTTVPGDIQIALELLSLIIALATIQLLMRNRYREQVFSHALDVARLRRGVPALDFDDFMEDLAGRRQDAHADWRSNFWMRIGRLPGWKTWTFVFLAFVALDVFLIVSTLT